MATGQVSQLDYAAALGGRLSVPVVAWNTPLDLADAAHEPATEIGLPARLAGRPCRVLAATDAGPAFLATQVAVLRAQGVEVLLAPRMLIDAALEARARPERIEQAALGLLRRQPASSAGAPVATWQQMAGVGLAGLLIGGFAVLPDATLLALTALVALPFLCVTALRLVALRQALASPASKVRAGSVRAERVPDRLLPVYTVLVPVFREANVLPGLIRSLRALDYPAAKLEIFIVLEESDVETQAAVLSQALPGNFRSLIVPEGGPQTKPKALNYALQLARGDFVVVYDAEDRPQPGQLRRAWDVFRRAPPGLACLQAQLNIYNPRQSWFTKQFTIEYSVLFDAILPALEKLRLPVPLGGTSNHFPRGARGRGARARACRDRSRRDRATAGNASLGSREAEAAPRERAARASCRFARVRCPKRAEQPASRDSTRAIPFPQQSQSRVGDSQITPRVGCCGQSPVITCNYSCGHGLAFAADL